MAQASPPLPSPTGLNAVGIPDEVILGHGQMVVRVARYYKQRAPYRVDLRDLVQVGWCGFLQGAKKWDPSKKVTIGAYCSPWVRGAIHRYLFGNKTPQPVWESNFYQLKTRQSIGHHEDLSIAEPLDPETESTRLILRDLLELLPEESRKIVQSLHLENKTPSQTARECGVLVGDVLAVCEESVKWLREVAG